MGRTSELKSGMGVALETFKSLIEAVEDQGGGDEDVRRIKTDEKLRREIAALILGTRGETFSIDLWPNGTTVAQMIEAGKYDWRNDNITDQSFPPTRSEATEIVLVHFNRTISTKDAERELDKRGLRPATLPELLALGAKHPDLQRQFPIIALGSVWADRDGDRGVAYLVQGGSRRGLGLHWCDGDWGGGCRFAAVRK